MNTMQKTDIPEMKKAIVILHKLNADEKVKQEAFYREKRLHDEASALGAARKEGRAEGRAEGQALERSAIVESMKKQGISEEMIKAILSAMND